MPTPSLCQAAVEWTEPHRIRSAMGRSWLRCHDCGQVWAVNVKPGGGFYRGWWHCPNRCNVGITARVS